VITNTIKVGSFGCQLRLFVRNDRKFKYKNKKSSYANMSIPNLTVHENGLYVNEIGNSSDIQIHTLFVIFGIFSGPVLSVGICLVVLILSYLLTALVKYDFNWGNNLWECFDDYVLPFFEVFGHLTAGIGKWVQLFYLQSLTKI